ncbi:hypothetical protein PENFLA_c035G06272 [Penicillium flavigenum]|uniref:Cytochrome P450 n=1 Tax=Penicillium flavigenum TaxID=254877 RepID=A0A1V6SLC2_9EURO|nr:hypothetical protein PENFLA_c035G06272 [Penicillium flavigenum]
MPYLAIIIYILGLVVLASFIFGGKRPSKSPPQVKWVGKPGFFRQIWLSLRGIDKRFDHIRHGYRKFNAKGLPFIIPDSTFIPLVVTPPEHVKWLIGKPDHILTQRNVIRELLGLKYLLPDLHHGLDVAFTDVVRRHMTREFGKFQEALYDELHQAIDETLGLDHSSQRQVCLAKAMETILQRSIDRVVFGLPLCRDNGYVRSWRKFNNSLALMGVILGLIVPWFLRPFLGWFFRIPVEFWRRRSLKYLTPIFQERSKQMEEQKRKGIPIGSDMPDDFITWYLQAGRNGRIHNPPDVSTIAMHFHFFCVSLYKSTIMTGTSAMLDLLSADPTMGYWEKIIEEAMTEYHTEGDWLEARTVSKLPYLDSALRETLRRNPMNIRGIPREIISKEGVTLPSGTHLPQGTWVTTAVDSLHNDKRFYENPEEYQPFRFVAHSESTAWPQAGDATSFTTTNDKFLAFGYGRHGCPGRWFASHVLKLVFAYIAIHYDVQHIGKPPPKIRFGDFTIPSLATTITVRRK